MSSGMPDSSPSRGRGRKRGLDDGREGGNLLEKNHSPKDSTKFRVPVVDANDGSPVLPDTGKQPGAEGRA